MAKIERGGVYQIPTAADRGDWNTDVINEHRLMCYDSMYSKNSMVNSYFKVYSMESVTNYWLIRWG